MNKIHFNQFTQNAPGKFHGGVHPPEMKSLSSESVIGRIPPADTLLLPLQQHIGKPAVAAVTEGQTVFKGQLLAGSSKSLGANIHAPCDGVVERIAAFPTGHPSGMPTQAILLRRRSSSEVGKKEDRQPVLLTKHSDWQAVDRSLLLQQIKAAGIVGLGGATFPTDIKLSPCPIDTLIVNAMECEPYITCDDRLLREQSATIISGANIAASIIQAKEIVFAIEDNKPEAISALQSAISASEKGLTSLRILVAPTKYPSGGEKQTIELVTGKQVPKGQLPASLGIVVQNVATLYAVHQAITEGQPLTERLVTITGDLAKNPGNYWLPFGTSIDYLIEQFNVDQAALSTVIFGGPMMGVAIQDQQVPTTKSTNCIIFNSDSKSEKNYVIQAKPHRECIRCGECQTACPVDLLPQQLYWYSESEQWEPLEQQGLFDCIECGACAYVCPSEIPLVHYYRFGKSQLKKLERDHAKAERAKQRFDFREQRLAEAKKAREAKRQKVAEAREKAAAENDDTTVKKQAINDALARVKQKKQETSTEGQEKKSE